MVVTKSDTARIQPGDIREALGLLTRLRVKATGARGAAAAWAWPVAGALVGLIAAFVGWCFIKIDLPTALAAALSLSSIIILTGAMHEDGLADCADGFWGAWDIDRRLSIMKDSQIGTYGTLALVLGLVLRWQALAFIFQHGWIFGPLVATAALSRFPLVGVMYLLEPARKHGLSSATGRPDFETVVLAACAGVAVSLLFIGFATLPALLTMAALMWLTSRIAIAKIGGQTGDVLGASQQIAEIGILLTLAVCLI